MASTHDSFQQDWVAACSFHNLVGLAFFSVRCVCKPDTFS